MSSRKLIRIPQKPRVRKVTKRKKVKPTKEQLELLELKEEEPLIVERRKTTEHVDTYARRTTPTLFSKNIAEQKENLEALKENHCDTRHHKILNALNPLKYSGNSFSLALEDYDLLYEPDIYHIYKDHIHWYEFDSPELYTESLSEYASYLTYIIIIQMFHLREFDLSYYEDYFTSQLASYCEVRNSLSFLKNFRLLKDYWLRTLKIIEYLSNNASRFDRLAGNVNVPLVLSNDDVFNFTIPFIGMNDKKQEIDLYLIFNYKDHKPSWYSIPGLLYIIKYYHDLNVSIKNLTIMWFNRETFLEQTVQIENIPITNNVLTLAKRYGNVKPNPFSNIYHRDNIFKLIRHPISVLLNQVENQ